MDQTLGRAPALKSHYTTVIIGSGFGGTMTALTLAKAYKERAANEDILILERGTWWTTPVSTVQDKGVRAYDRLKARGEPVQFWSSAENFKGLIDIATRCIRRKGNEDGLYDLTRFEKRGFLGLFGNRNDGVSVLRASGVGGGSLVYANVTIQPPSFIFDDVAWPPEWKNASEQYYTLAKDAIGYGVLHALDDRNPPINTGLSNIATRSARLNPHWPKDASGNDIKRINLAPDPNVDPKNDLWLDRARVFQTTISGMTDDYGTVYSSINDIPSEPNGYDPGQKPKNYCERQGRCLVGCLPGARHTLNKQLMAAALVNPKDPNQDPEYLHILKVQALAEVSFIRPRPAEVGGYEVHFVLHHPDKPSKRSGEGAVTCENVIVAAGCLGTNEIMLRSHRRDRLPNLSDKLGYGFSTNGDLLAFLPNTDEKVYLTKGPITTSYGHFNSGSDADHQRFHTVEDNGIPRALASLTSFGVPTLQKITLDHGNRGGFFLVLSLLPKIAKRFWRIARAPFINDRTRQDTLESEDEMLANMMCVAVIGRSAADGQFSLGRGRRETPLRVMRPDGMQFKDDPIYGAIGATLDEFAAKLSKKTPTPKFLTPWETTAAKALDFAATALSHPLGGCRMAQSVHDGVCDQYGRVYDKSRDGQPNPFYKGLYIADAALIPTSLGVNPSLTISAVALRAVQHWLGNELQRPTTPPAGNSH